MARKLRSKTTLEETAKHIIYEMLQKQQRHHKETKKPKEYIIEIPKEEHIDDNEHHLEYLLPSITKGDLRDSSLRYMYDGPALNPHNKRSVLSFHKDGK